MYYVSRFAALGCLMVFCFCVSVWSYKGATMRDLASVQSEYSKEGPQYSPKFYYDSNYKI